MRELLVSIARVETRTIAVSHAIAAVSSAVSAGACEVSHIHETLEGIECDLVTAINEHDAIWARYRHACREQHDVRSETERYLAEADYVLLRSNSAMCLLELLRPLDGSEVETFARRAFHHANNIYGRRRHSPHTDCRRSARCTR